MASINILPEELTEQILCLCVTASFDPPSPRPKWLTSTSPTSPSVVKRRSSSAIRNRLAPLLVSKSFHRIALPHYYSIVHIASPDQATALLHTLRTQEHFVAPYVQRFVSASIFPQLGAILQCCKNIRDIDICLDSGPTSSGGVDLATKEFCDALNGLRGIGYFSLRKAPNAYLTLPRIRYVLTRLAAAVESWACLESANVAFRMSDDNPQALLAMAYFTVSQGLPSLSVLSTPLSASTPVSDTSPPTSPLIISPSAGGGPIDLLTNALAKSPSLQTFATQVPSVWNEAILRVSQNPSLQKVVLGDPKTGVLTTGLFMAESKKHPRLVELIKAGTLIVRTRAYTLGSFGNIASSVSTPSTPQSKLNINATAQSDRALVVRGLIA
ncbi:hypothetical protein EV368DRAFT_84803 [Lentinula lateritia]|uniref:Uncharacterized protein n=1 Tax=Lentinula aff. lateritia TaxID=2804960 RepID=A0ACC1TUD4_9AGAR|nr:hypothetical protein F5876DRAFT_78841 [Lentinula aff. lateritia]KAJ3850167.1 hypothetical protein EV368DRAFT_84803 [Lentinula lateritia]